MTTPILANQRAKLTRIEYTEEGPAMKALSSLGQWTFNCTCFKDTECICPCGYPRSASSGIRKRPGSGITEATSSRRQRPTRRLQGQSPGQEKRVPKATEGIANPSWGWGGAESPLRASLTSLEPRGLRAASRGTRCPQGGGWGRAPARRTAPSPDSAPPLPQSKRWRTRKLPRTGTDFRANRAAALAFSGGSDAIGSCSRRAEMSKVEGCAWPLLRKLEDGVPCQITRP
ncbi:uncharacterized protein LOC129032926 [Pongo pygmaeus]|uniref:uncharacterized protein LOC129032926 n=1 Tax=Pongo pygmaeus TaxID=9600 RepID=UPI0023E34FB5|nr:uncharacterized protein LOC129032926 [Pongo pygmaeus]